jgi:hypothetical protein
MNVVGAAGLCLLGAIVLFEKAAELPLAVLVPIAAFYAILAAIPAYTAKALSPAGLSSLRRRMWIANWALVVFACIGVVGNVIVGSSIVLALVGACIFVIPGWINIRALRKPAPDGAAS